MITNMAGHEPRPHHLVDTTSSRVGSNKPEMGPLCGTGNALQIHATGKTSRR